MLLTSVEFHHADIYADIDAVKTAFRRLVNLVPRRGSIVAQGESATVSECVARAFCPVETFGFIHGDWRALDVSMSGSGTVFHVEHRGERIGRLAMQLSGDHNVMNVLSAVAIASRYGIAWNSIVRAIETFQGVRRRLEIVGEVDGVTVVDDFAHHPTAIRETLRAARSRFPGQRLWALIEPRSNTLRRNVFEAELVEALSNADHVVMAEVFNKDKLLEAERLNPENVLAGLSRKGIAAEPGGTADQIVESLLPRFRTGDAVIVMSNGGFGGIHRKLLQGLAQRRAGSTIAQRVVP